MEYNVTCTRAHPFSSTHLCFIEGAKVWRVGGCDGGGRLTPENFHLAVAIRILDRILSHFPYNGGYHMKDIVASLSQPEFIKLEKRMDLVSLTLDAARHFLAPSATSESDAPTPVLLAVDKLRHANSNETSTLMSMLCRLLDTVSVKSCGMTIPKHHQLYLAISAPACEPIADMHRLGLHVINKSCCV